MKIAGVLLESGRLRIQNLRNHDSWCHGQSEEMSESLYTYRRLSAYWLNSMAEDTWKLSWRPLPECQTRLSFDGDFGQNFVCRVVEAFCCRCRLPSQRWKSRRQRRKRLLAFWGDVCVIVKGQTPLNLYPPHETSQSSMIGKDLESWAWSFSV